MHNHFKLVQGHTFGNLGQNLKRAANQDQPAQDEDQTSG